MSNFSDLKTLRDIRVAKYADEANCENLVQFLLGVDSSWRLLCLDRQAEDGSRESGVDEIGDVSNNIDLARLRARDLVSVHLKELACGLLVKLLDFLMPLVGIQ